ncbi:MAG: putative toxin-antitoxin system toxin component, PIN family [Gemmataceae bacterium]
MISAVFDTTTLLQAATSRNGPAAACLAFVDSGQVSLPVSALTLDEIRDVLQRPAIRKAFPKLSDENIRDFLDHLVEKGRMVDDVPAVYHFPRDPADEPYINLAICTSASYIVSRDNDLLDLMNDLAFRKAHPGIQILDPVAFLKVVRAEARRSTGP